MLVSVVNRLISGGIKLIGFSGELRMLSNESKEASTARLDKQVDKYSR